MNFVVSVPTVGGQSQYSYYCTVTENSYDISTNKSNVTIAFSIKGVSATYSDWTTYYGIIVDDVIKTNGNKKMTVDGNKYYRVTEWTGNIDHNNNGSKTINVSIFLHHNGPENYMPKQYTADSPLQIGSVQLTTIPRKSEISYAGNTVIGSKCDIRWTPASSDFKYKIKFSLGTWNHTTGYIVPGATSLYTYTGYTIPSDDTILNNLTRDSGTMKAVLRTYNKENALIGTSSEKSFTVQISGSLAPTVGTITLTPQTYEYLLQGKNKLQIDASGWSASTGSTITSYTFSGDGITTTTTPNSCITVGPISKTGELTFTVKATDTRNQSSTSATTITCYAYKAPTFTSFNISNMVKDDNGNATINCSYTITYYSVNSTNGINTFTINGAGTGASIAYGNWTISKPNSSGVITASGSSVISLGTNIASSYNIYATVGDNYGGSRNSKTESVYGEDRVFNIYPDGTGVAIGKMADSPNLFECRWPAKFNDNVTMPSNGGPILNGYSVGTLGRGKEITKNSNLNDYTTPGIYDSLESAVSSSLDNCPWTSSGFRLTVEYIGASGYLKQIIEPRNSRSIYMRYYTTTSNIGWVDWVIFNPVKTGTCTLSNTNTTITFDPALGSVPTVMLTLNDSAVSDIAVANIVSVSRTGFTAKVSGVSSAKFAYLATYS